MTKRAVVLFNLGGPDSPAAVEPFLHNLFKDPAIITLPWFIRLPLAKFISRRRAPIAQEIYAQIGGRSPLLKVTREQAVALELALLMRWPSDDTRVFVAMRYWHPMSDETVKQVKEYAPDEVILLPLYPQYSTTSTGSSLADWIERADRHGLNPPTYAICCYPTQEGWLSAQSKLLKETLARVPEGKTYKVLFSAHGLPQKIVNRGDPYQWQVEQSAAALARTAGLDDDQWSVCYQSRVGRLKWIGPSLDEALAQAAKDDPALVVLPIAFVSEHSETLVELDIEYKKIAADLGITDYLRVPAVATEENFINGLAELAVAAGKRKIPLGPDGETRYCPADHRRCPFTLPRPANNTDQMSPHDRAFRHRVSLD